MSAQAEGTIESLSSSTLGRLNESKVSLVDFWASWCVPCRKLAPIYEQAGAETRAKHPGQVAFYKINVEEEPSLASQFGVMSIPAVLAFSGGKPVDRFSGRTKEDLIRWIEKLLGSK